MTELRFWACVIPREMLADHERRGGKKLVRLMADLPGGDQLRVMGGREPWKPGKVAWHLSVSVSRPGVVEPTRRPTDDEVQAALQQWPNFQFDEDGAGVADQRVRHFWQR